MFRIARVRIRWIHTNQHNADVVSMTQSAQNVGDILSRRLWILNPVNWHVHISWVGFGLTSSTPSTTAVTAQMSESLSISSPTRVLGTFDMPRTKVRVSWIGFDSPHSIQSWMLVLFVIGLGIFAFTRFSHVNHPDQRLDAKSFTLPAGLITDQIDLGDQTIQMSHSALDIGQAKDVFDGDIETLMRGLEANPFIIDLQFSQPQVIKGLMMDFGRMNFAMRVQVYGTDGAEPVSYQGEYRQQPDIPHLDLDFVNGPKQVKRIYIEIEQLLPPEEVHIHVREIVFKN
jgi:hypothetical protein